MKVQLPTGSPLQCPLCGQPVDTARVVIVPSGEKALDFDCCGNAITFAAMRDAFGLDLDAADTPQ